MSNIDGGHNGCPSGRVEFVAPRSESVNWMIPAGLLVIGAGALFIDLARHNYFEALGLSEKDVDQMLREMRISMGLND